uniref:Transthyretin/hydroxyisourate hydrolase domain-containing protein n=1 Tax=Ailuropoda melanoleuca TaxID=9646 RepID=A0A7N5PAY1_AILME
GISGKRELGPMHSFLSLYQGKVMELVSSPLTTHVLDTPSGFPAQGPYLHLFRKSYTDYDGCCPSLLAPGPLKAGNYKLSFDTKGYWKKRGAESFYSYVEVAFTITNETHRFCASLLLSLWSYITYQGS